MIRQLYSSLHVNGDDNVAHYGNDEVNYGEAERGSYEPIKNLEDADVHINAKEFNLAKQQQTSTSKILSQK